MNAEIIIEDERWQTLELNALAGRSIAAVLEHLGMAEAAELSVLACNDAQIATLNAEFRGKPTPTNVLSWPTEELAAATDGGTPDRPEPDFTDALELGDIAIAWETCEREAAEQGKDMTDHVTHLLVHGLLHLLGYDHIRDADATLMEGLERRILGKMGIDDPYRETPGG